MLATPDSSISQIACQLGYTDPAHFTRAFMAWKGMSPRAWRLACATLQSDAARM
ncbi:helix-turn-helix transcriptional regulator (plasmid) [Sinorhizobium meliloti WSM1022]|uniref:Helix-turn-helix domain-containing protein n=1 Tax=Rhizobium meliloti TaxID=382 RepID=A0A6A7ZZB3_RHIML|nr:helix-turn-helix transcriptional regulator [Sinorhizobium meliloti]QKN18186.1 helix-turn-helix transcriptional regulator [Sinorhizobium meliloti WSM1022]MDE4579277.1 AraC family transcriptional regulator [Sinorhizobium meliloti]MDW9626733.1 helix-turn-helix domain-containing protein [Sinorhizobium meliloti]MDW9697765.1 helix-turn-helix domain-containing protein [Sinorhizobium meliloti]